MISQQKCDQLKQLQTKFIEWRFPAAAAAASPPVAACAKEEMDKENAAESELLAALNLDDKKEDGSITDPKVATQLSITERPKTLGRNVGKIWVVAVPEEEKQRVFYAKIQELDATIILAYCAFKQMGIGPTKYFFHQFPENEEMGIVTEEVPNFTMAERVQGKHEFFPVRGKDDDIKEKFGLSKDIDLGTLDDAFLLLWIRSFFEATDIPSNDQNWGWTSNENGCKFVLVDFSFHSFTPAFTSGANCFFNELESMYSRLVGCGFRRRLLLSLKTEESRSELIKYFKKRFPWCKNSHVFTNQVLGPAFEECQEWIGDSLDNRPFRNYLAGLRDKTVGLFKWF